MRRLQVHVGSCRVMFMFMCELGQARGLVSLCSCVCVCVCVCVCMRVCVRAGVQVVFANLCLALCLHFRAKSVFRFRSPGFLKFLSMWSFSVKHRSHSLPPFLYTGVFCRISHLMFGFGCSWFSHMWFESVVEFFCSSCRKECLWE